MPGTRCSLRRGAAALVLVALGSAAAQQCSDRSLDECFSGEPGGCAIDPDTDACRDAGCQDQQDQPECEGSPLGCKWHESVFFCGKAGEPVPCSKYYDKSECPATCTYHTSGLPEMSEFGACVEKGEPKPCELYSDATCPSATCDSEGGICITKPPQPCYSFETRADCPTDRCEFGEYGCMVPVPMAPCPAPPPPGACGSKSSMACEVYDLATGESTTGCVFDFEQNKCRPPACTDNSITPEMCRCAPGCEFNEAAALCIERGQGVDCGRIYDEANCGAVSTCEWLGDLYICNAKGRPAPCTAYYEQSTCTSKGVGCKWFAGADEGAGECLDEAAQKPCRLYSKDACPSARCAATEYSCEALTPCPESSAAQCAAAEAMDCMMPGTGCWLDPSSRRCRAAECSELSDAFACRCKDGCEFTAAVSVCHKTGEKLPCSVYFDSDMCAAAQCEFDSVALYCKDKGAETPCDKFGDSGTCSGECLWLQGPAGAACIDKGGVAPCEVYDDATCPFTGRPHDQQCKRYPEYGTCESRAPCPPPPPPVTDATCGTNADFEKCEAAAGCAFSYTEGGAGDGLAKCKAATCVDLFDDDMCSCLRGCKWVAPLSRCVDQSTVIACDQYSDKAGCPTDECAWFEGSAAGACIDKGGAAPCQTFSGETCPTRCEAAPPEAACAAPTGRPTTFPTHNPTGSPSTSAPTTYPTPLPTSKPTSKPTERGQTPSPSTSPTTSKPTQSPTAYPSAIPTKFPTVRPTTKPTAFPTAVPSSAPTLSASVYVVLPGVRLSVMNDNDRTQTEANVIAAVIGVSDGALAQADIKTAVLQPSSRANGVKIPPRVRVIMTQEAAAKVVAVENKPVSFMVIELGNEIGINGFAAATVEESFENTDLDQTPTARPTLATPTPPPTANPTRAKPTCPQRKDKLCTTAACSCAGLAGFQRVRDRYAEFPCFQCCDPSAAGVNGCSPVTQCSPGPNQCTALKGGKTCECPSGWETFDGKDSTGEYICRGCCNPSADAPVGEACKKPPVIDRACVAAGSNQCTPDQACECQAGFKQLSVGYAPDGRECFACCDTNAALGSPASCTEQCPASKEVPAPCTTDAGCACPSGLVRLAGTAKTGDGVESACFRCCDPSGTDSTAAKCPADVTAEPSPMPTATTPAAQVMCTTQAGFCTRGQCGCESPLVKNSLKTADGDVCYSCGAPTTTSVVATRGEGSPCTSVPGRCTPWLCSCTLPRVKRELQAAGGTVCYACEAASDGDGAVAGENACTSEPGRCTTGLCSCSPPRVKGEVQAADGGVCYTCNIAAPAREPGAATSAPAEALCTSDAGFCTPPPCSCEAGLEKNELRADSGDVCYSCGETAAPGAGPTSAGGVANSSDAPAPVLQRPKAFKTTSQPATTAVVPEDANTVFVALPDFDIEDFSPEEKAKTEVNAMAAAIMSSDGALTSADFIEAVLQSGAEGTVVRLVLRDEANVPERGFSLNIEVASGGGETIVETYVGKTAEASKDGIDQLARGSGGDDDSGGDTSGSGGGGGGSSSGTVIAVVIAIVVVSAVAIAVILKRRRDAEPEAAVHTPATAAQKQAHMQRYGMEQRGVVMSNSAYEPPRGLSRTASSYESPNRGDYC